MAVTTQTRTNGARRARKNKPDAEIVLICNPRAGGKWKALAGILDSDQARHARRVVTDSVEDVAMAVEALSDDVRLLCIYGGDGTVQRILDRIPTPRLESLQLVLLGGGTMNVTSRWCGFSPNPTENFKLAVDRFLRGELLVKEVPIMNVHDGTSPHRAFTFGMGPVVRLLDAYEQGRKGKVAAVGTAIRGLTAAWTGWPKDHARLLDPMRATLTLDGERVPYDSFTAVFTNVTGEINPGVAPFVEDRKRDAFLCAACAVGPKELTLALPMLARGYLPPDVVALLEPDRALRSLGRAERLADPRYVNRSAKVLEIDTDETMYTLDGEILQRDSTEPLRVSVGPQLRLATGAS